MALFGGRTSMLEVQNRALVKTARERAAQIDKLEAELQGFSEKAEQIEKLQRDLQALQARADRQTDEIDRLTLERDIYSKKASDLEEHNRQLVDAATQYSLYAQKLERELTAAAAKYSRWGQSLERELAKIDPDGAFAREFGAWSANQANVERR